MRKHRLGKQLLIVLCVVLIVFLAGCRPSPVLEQIIYEQNHQVDPDTETKTMNDDLENEEPDENIPSRETVDDSEQTKDESHTAALAGDTDTSDDTDAVYDVEYSPSGDLSEPDETNPTEGSTSETATGSTEAGGDEGGYTPSGEGEEPGNDGMSAEQSNGGENAGEEQTGGVNADLDGGPATPDTTQETPDSGKTMKQVLDATGDYVEVPENVGTVTAVGEIATMVEMLGGSNRLLASSESFRDNSLAQQAFASQGAGNVQCWWAGDGSTSACYNFDVLLGADPDVCFEISGQETFNSDQIATLKASGISYVLLWPLDSISNIENDVTLVGQVLGNNADYGVDSESKAKSYCDWVNNNVLNRLGGGSKKATAYIARWDDDAYWSITRTDGYEVASGYGAPVAMATSGVLQDCMNRVNVVNTASNNYYVDPLQGLYWRPNVEGNTGARYRSQMHIIYSDELGVGLGNGAYPAVIVADSSIKDHIMLGADQGYYWWHWRSGESIYFENTWAHGILLEDGTYLTTWIESDNYEILVNPSGVGNWMGGSAESPLEVAWLACKFQDKISLGDMRNLVADFYNTFYNGFQVDTAAILGE